MSLKIVVPADGIKSGPTRKGGVWRQQKLLVHQRDEVRAVTFFLGEDDKPMEPGEYALSPEAVYAGDITRIDKRTGQIRTELGLVVAMRPSSFVKLSAAKVAAVGGR